MTNPTIDFFRRLFPFILTLFLWRMDIAWINPAGLLALVPIFFYTFIRPTPWFALFAAVMCFLIDYRADNLLFWTSVFCLCYAVNGFQNYVDLTRAENDGWAIFATVFSIAVLIISLPHMTYFTNVFRVIWTILWVNLMYMPIIILIKRIAND